MSLANFGGPLLDLYLQLVVCFPKLTLRLAESFPQVYLLRQVIEVANDSVLAVLQRDPFYPPIIRLVVINVSPRFARIGRLVGFTGLKCVPETIDALRRKRLLPNCPE